MTKEIWKSTIKIKADSYWPGRTIQSRWWSKAKSPEIQLSKQKQLSGDKPCINYLDLHNLNLTVEVLAFFIKVLSKKKSMNKLNISLR